VKPRTLARLDLIAAERERRLLDEVKRHNATLEQIAQQRGILSAYRERLSSSWRDGAPVRAGQAQSAGHFVAASRSADSQIDAMEADARRQLAAALQNLANTQAHRSGLDEAQDKAALALERATAEREALAQPWRPQPGSGVRK